jgi:hypothetical protein
MRKKRIKKPSAEETKSPKSSVLSLLPDLLAKFLQSAQVPADVVEGRFTKLLHEDFKDHLIMVMARLLFSQDAKGLEAFDLLISTWKKGHLDHIPEVEMPEEHRKILLGALDKMEYILHKMMSDTPDQAVPNGLVQ